MTNRCKRDKKESFTLNFCVHEMLRAFNLVIMKNAPDEKRKVVKKTHFSYEGNMLSSPRKSFN